MAWLGHIKSEKAESRTKEVLRYARRVALSYRCLVIRLGCSSSDIREQRSTAGLLKGLHARFPRPMSGFALVHYLPITPASASAEAGVRQEYDRILLQPCHTSPFFRPCCWAPSCWLPQPRHGLNKPPMRVRSCSKFLHRPVCPPSSRILAMMQNRHSPW